MGKVLSASEAREGNEISPNSILVENGVYKLYYHSYLNGKRRIGMATSSDGITWTKNVNNPIVEVGAAGAYDDQYVVEPRVFKLGTGNYRMYYSARRLSPDTHLLTYATSTDGNAWTKSNQILDIPPTMGTGGGIIKDGNEWHIWYAPDWNFTHYAKSADGLDWTIGVNNPVLKSSTAPSGAPDSSYLGDSVSGYLAGNEFRVLFYMSVFDSTMVRR